ncbi:hypothetical protein Bbelb_116030 [Branchiostoma belcheri]|nr:hypothetical protein Bbelb_116030 [Branchiostoma belcheri]
MQAVLPVSHIWTRFCSCKQGQLNFQETCTVCACSHDENFGQCTTSRWLNISTTWIVEESSGSSTVDFAQNMFDGDSATVWEPLDKPEGYEHWVIVDLQSSFRIHRGTIANNGDVVHDVVSFVMESSTTSPYVWETAYSSAEVLSGIPMPQYFTPEFFGRYLKLKVNTQSGVRPSLREVSLYGKENTGDPESLPCPVLNTDCIMSDTAGETAPPGDQDCYVTANIHEGLRSAADPLQVHRSANVHLHGDLLVDCNEDHEEWRLRTSLLARHRLGFARCTSVVCTPRLGVSGCVHRFRTEAVLTTDALRLPTFLHVDSTQKHLEVFWTVREHNQATPEKAMDEILPLGTTRNNVLLSIAPKTLPLGVHMVQVVMNVTGRGHVSVSVVQTWVEFIRVPVVYSLGSSVRTVPTDDQTLTTRLGCWRDGASRAIPILHGPGPILGGTNYRLRTDAIRKCGDVATSRGYEVFAIQNGGQCASSADARQTYNRYGPSTRCLPDGEGGPWANEVYLLTRDNIEVRGDLSYDPEGLLPTAGFTYNWSCRVTRLPAASACASVRDRYMYVQQPSWVVSSSGTPWVNNGVTHDAGKAFDGDPATYWNPQNTLQYSTDRNIVLDFRLPYTVTKVAWYTFGDVSHDIAAFKLQKSQVGSPYIWKDVVSFTNIPVGADQRTARVFGGFQGTARYWRFVVTQTPNGWQPYLRELQLFISLGMRNVHRHFSYPHPCPHSWNPEDLSAPDGPNFFCTYSLGMESGAIPNDRITASSYYYDAAHAPYRARLNGVAGVGSWSVRYNRIGEWLQVGRHFGYVCYVFSENVGKEWRLLTSLARPSHGCAKCKSVVCTPRLAVDLGEMKTVTGTIIQGRYHHTNQWVTSYKLQYSVDGLSWITYASSDGSEEVFPGNTNRYTPVTNLLNSPTGARYVRFLPQSWYGHMSMRVEVLGCSVNDDPSTMETIDIPEGFNVAEGRRTWTNYRVTGKTPEKVVDGNTNTDMYHGSCMSTVVNQPDPWLMIDLCHQFSINRVVLYSRMDFEPERINPFNLHLGNVPEVLKNPTWGGDLNFDPAQLTTKTIPVAGVRARYVGIRLPGPSRTLQLCEVQVFVNDRYISPRESCVLLGCWRVDESHPGKLVFDSPLDYGLHDLIPALPRPAGLVADVSVDVTAGDLPPVTLHTVIYVAPVYTLSELDLQ